MDFKKIITIIFLLFSVMTFSQGNTKSVLILSEESLISLLKTIKEKRAEIIQQKLKFDDVVDTKNQRDLIQIASELQEVNSQNTITSDTNLQNFSLKLKSLEQELHLIQKNLEKLNQIENKTEIKNSISENKKEVKLDSLKNLNQINSKLDSVLLTDNKTEKFKQLSESLNELKIKYQNVLNELAKENKVADKKSSDEKNKTATSLYAEKMKKYRDFKKQVYFENNSSEVNEQSKAILDEIIFILNKDTQLDIALKGFASNTGNPKYNNELSYLRAESVKRYLVSKSIHPNRILTQHHGIDYTAKEESMARRVEASIVVRK